MDIILALIGGIFIGVIIATLIILAIISITIRKAEDELFRTTSSGNQKMNKELEKNRQKYN
jgi:hypothetical protein